MPLQQRVKDDKEGRTAAGRWKGGKAAFPEARCFTGR